MNKHYDPAIIEAEAQQYWEEHHSFECAEETDQEKFYCLSMLPYPSGDLHMGHVRNYTIGDVIARYHRMTGKQVLQPMGWDAFGLPAENAAISRHLPPAEWTKKNIEIMRGQFKRLGYAYDWRREITTCEPDYYRWEQWLFIQLYKEGLVYKKNAVVNWDPVDQTVLANEQVIDGKGWRSGAPVERRDIPQWFLKITAYAEELLNELDKLTGWPPAVLTMQRNWIGRSEGVNVHFSVENQPEKLTIFTTRPDTLMGVTYIAVAPEHPLALEKARHNPAITSFIEECRHTKVAEADMATQSKKGVPLDLYALHPLTQEKLPLWAANFVALEYGSGAVMAVPAHDQRDFEFAAQYQLPLKIVIQPPADKFWDFKKAAYTEAGQLIHSDSFNGECSETAKKKMSEYLIRNQLAEKQVHYRLRDWGISRQRYWGTPIPIITCPHCGDLPVPETDLPVLLPLDLIPDGHASPLKSTPSFYEVQCPKCASSEAKRETDTMDTFMESSWYYARYACYNQNQAMLDDRANYWVPVDQYIGGVEHAILHLLYARFVHKLLRDQGLLNSDEPFTRLLTQGMVLKDGFKMSKSKGNIVAPLALIEQYGADTVRLFTIFAAPPEQSLEWSDSGVEGAFRFLKKLWHFAMENSDALQHAPALGPLTLTAAQTALYQQIHLILKQAQQDMDRLQLNTVVSAGMKLLNVLSAPVTDENTGIFREGLSILLRLLSPIVPHITHHLWHVLKFGPDISKAPWPKVNEEILKTGEVEIVIQINGKVRGKIKVSQNASEKELEQAALKEENIVRHLAQQHIKKIIIVPKKLINIVAH